MGIRPPTALPKTIREFIAWCRNATLTEVIRGAGSPEGVVVADRGTLFLRSDGGAGTCMYSKEGGDGTANGWVAK